MDKILTISIAAYNVERYIKETLDSLICKNMNYLEVLIIDDGSKDSTAVIAKEYEEKYPKTFRVISKENGGYGSTINMGIKNATGKYFKQLDGDDKFDTKNLDLFIEKLINYDVDVVYTPYYTWKEDNKIPTYCGLEIYKDFESLDLNSYLKDFRKDIVMHSLTYKTKLLKENNIKILENAFYTDSEYALYPFLFAKTIKVFDFEIYIYRMGNVGQSVSRQGMRKHYEDFNKVIDSIIKNTVEKYSAMPDNNIKKYILYKIDNIFCISISNLILALPFSIRSYKYIKKIDSKIKLYSKVFYIDAKEHKTVHYFRKGYFLTYCALHILLLLKTSKKGE